MQLCGEGDACSTASEFIVDVNKSFQIRKGGGGEGGCNFITFGLNAGNYACEMPLISLGCAC